MPTQIQLRRGTAAQWTSANPTLAAGEVGIETDTRKTKYGDGTTAWSGLSYSAAGVSDHGALTGLSDDDHSQYHNDTRGDARYSVLAHNHTGVYSAVGHGHANTDITGLGGAAVLNVGTGAGTVAAGDDSRITGAAAKASNLSDLANAGTARTNLGLGGAAVLAVGTGAGTVCAGDDSRLTNQRAPTDGDKGDITVSASGATWTIDNSAVTLAKQADMATASLVYRKTAGSGAPEVNTLATLKTDLAIGVGDVSGLDEQIRDVIGTALTAGSGMGVTVDDGADTITLAPVVKQLVLTIYSGPSWAWTNMPAGLTAAQGSWAHMTRVDLTGYSQVRLRVNKMGTAPINNSKLILRYYTSYLQTASSHLDIGTSEVSVTMDTGVNKQYETSWIDLASGAKADVWISLLGSGGDGVADPTFGAVTAIFK
jgi:hypothetical protein